MNKDLFKAELKQIESQIEIAKDLDSVNSKLQEFNWIFLHPYSQGLDIGHLKLLSEGENPNERILSFFAGKFLDLRTTIHFIEGFYKKRPFLKDYANSIEESVILCLQKDFKGAISILLPVIEGTLRKYLVSKKGEQKKGEVKMSKLLSSIDDLTLDYLQIQEKYMGQSNQHLIISGNGLDVNQTKQILEKHKLYFEIWMKQLKSYLENNLYLPTNGTAPNDTFNRHIIFHALDHNIDFSFANYLRLFNCISYLSWAIGMTNENCSVLSEANEQDVMDKWADYLKILAVSESLIETKSNILGRKTESFKKYLPKQYFPLIEEAEKEIAKTLDVYNTLKGFEKTKINSIPKLFRGVLFLNKVRKAHKSQ